MDEVEALQERFAELVRLRIAKDTAKAAADRAKDEYDEYESDLWEEINESPLKGAIPLEIPGHGKVVFQKRETYRGRVLNEADLVEWARENDMLAEFTEPKISKARLNELVRERIEAREPLPPGADFYPTRYISMSFKEK